MIIHNAEQGSPEWFAARCGVPSASNFDKIIDTSGRPSKSREKYLYQCAGERIAGKVEETYQNAAMARGKEMEGEARQFYELTNGVTVEQVGFCVTEGKAVFGASPDGLVGKDGLLEIKSPLIYTHVGYLIAGTFPTAYLQQVAGQLLVTGRKWCDFISYYPGLKPLVIRITPDPKFQKALAVELELFCNELAAIVEKIK